MVFEETIENIKSTPSYEMDELYKYQSQECENNMDQEIDQEMNNQDDQGADEIVEDMQEEQEEDT